MAEIIHDQDDAVLPFSVEPLDVRGRVVRLGPAIDTLISRHGYPDAVARVVGEAAALTVLLGSSLKFEGRFQLQTKTDGAIEMIVVDFDTPDSLRAYARFDQQKLAKALDGGSRDSGALIGHGYLAMTIDQGSDMNRYQGVVPMEGQSLEMAGDQYFRQSEQIPTRIRLAVAELLDSGHTRYRAGGLLAQFMPSSSERRRRTDLPPGDIPEGHPLHDAPATEVDDAWLEATALIDTVEDHELVDPALTSEVLLYRLFHERGVRVFDREEVREACRCSHERIMLMMRQFSKKDRADMIGDDGRIGVTCEFCSRHYDLDPAEVEAQIDSA